MNEKIIIKVRTLLIDKFEFMEQSLIEIDDGEFKKSVHLAKTDFDKGFMAGYAAAIYDACDIIKKTKN